MKDSGIEWIGEIPEEWNLVKGKYLFKLRTTKGNTKNVQLLSPTQNFGVIPQELYEKLTGMIPVKLKSDADLQQMRTIYKGDYCISLRSFQGGFEYSKYDGVVSPAYQVFYPYKKINSTYYRYLFKNSSFIQKINSFTMSLRDGKNIAFSDFGNIDIPFPTFVEQNKIAKFLDKKISEINQTSQTIQQEIDALEEYRKSLITETVTKGLDKTVPMKDSGIEWIGEIPENWKLEKLKFLGTVRNGLTYSPEDLSDDGTLVLRSSNIKKGKVYDADNVYVNMFVPQNLILKENDLLICSRNGSAKLIGKNALINEKYAGSSFGAFMAVFRSKYNEYIHYVLNSNIFDYYIGSFLTSTINQLTNRNLLNLSIPFPASKTERQQIISFLKKKCSMIDFIIDKKKEQISCLTQYKQSIVYEYVTGKKQVSEKEGVKNAQ